MNNFINLKEVALKNGANFKKIFTESKNEQYVIQFLSSIINENICKINIENLNDDSQESIEIVDLYAKIDTGRTIFVELQMHKEGEKKKVKSLYSTRAIEEIKNMEWSYSKNNVIIINIFDFNYFDDLDEYLLESVSVLENHPNTEINTGLKEYFIELPKFRETKPDMNDIKNQWIALLDGEDTELIENVIEKNSLIQEFFNSKVTYDDIEKMLSNLGNEKVLKFLLEKILDRKIHNLRIVNMEQSYVEIDKNLPPLDVKVLIDNETMCGIKMYERRWCDFGALGIVYGNILLNSDFTDCKSYDIKNAIFIGILKFNEFKTNTYHNVGHMKFLPTDKESYVDMGYKIEDKYTIDNLEMHFIELPKLKKKMNEENK